MSDMFALQGRGNSGKSDTIKKIYSDLTKKYPNAHVQNLSPHTNDIKIIMTINKHIVGIESQGDPNSRLLQSLQDFSQAKCDIIICATRTSGMTVEWVKSFSKNYKIHFIPQVYASPHNQQASNLRVAQNIIAQAGL